MAKFCPQSPARIDRMKNSKETSASQESEPTKDPQIFPSQATSGLEEENPSNSTRKPHQNLIHSQTEPDDLILFGLAGSEMRAKSKSLGEWTRGTRSEPKDENKLNTPHTVGNGSRPRNWEGWYPRAAKGVGSSLRVNNQTVFCISQCANYVGLASRIAAEGEDSESRKRGSSKDTVRVGKSRSDDSISSKIKS